MATVLPGKLSRQVKVVQSGQGAGEVFAGYGYHQLAASVPRSAAGDVFVKSFFDRRHDDLGQVLESDRVPSVDASLQVVRDQMSMPGAETALDAWRRLISRCLPWLTSTAGRVEHPDHGLPPG